jgi:hypothetical protein
MAIRGTRVRDPRRIYCEQYGYFWKFTLPSFLAMCQEGRRTGVVDLSRFGTELKSKPRGIYKARGSNKSWSAGGFTTMDPNVFLFRTLDKEKGEFAEAYHDVRIWWNERGRKLQ